MAGGYYEAGPGRAAGVRSLFGSIAPRYDLINDVQSLGLHRWWKRRLVRLSRVRPGERVLDVCCGTGDIAARLWRCGARVVGLDFTAGMLEVAQRRRGAKGGGGGLTYVAGDALRLPFAAMSFDLLTIAYGLRNLPNFAAGLAEFRRVTRPGGRLLILDFGKPSSRVWRWLYWGYLRGVVPVYGRVLSGDAAAYRYILESLAPYPEAEGVTALMQAAGWAEVEVHRFLGGVMDLHTATNRSVGVG